MSFLQRHCGFRGLHRPPKDFAKVGQAPNALTGLAVVAEAIPEVHGHLIASQTPEESDTKMPDAASCCAIRPAL